MAVHQSAVDQPPAGLESKTWLFSLKFKSISHWWLILTVPLQITLLPDVWHAFGIEQSSGSILRRKVVGNFSPSSKVSIQRLVIEKEASNSGWLTKERDDPHEPYERGILWLTNCEHTNGATPSKIGQSFAAKPFHLDRRPDRQWTLPNCSVRNSKAPKLI